MHFTGRRVSPELILEPGGNGAALPSDEKSTRASR